MKCTLIKNWRRAWKFASVRLSFLFAVVAGLYPFMGEMKSLLPEGHWVVSALFFVVIVARVVQLQKGSGDAESDRD